MVEGLPNLETRFGSSGKGPVNRDCSEMGNSKKKSVLTMADHFVNDAIKQVGQFLELT